MNDHFSSPPPLPDDEAHDPLLRALRQRLGEGFGQEPPPQLWASIREQLPVALPWWRRRRFLLPLLALLLLSTGALWQAGRLHRAALRAGRGGKGRALNLGPVVVLLQRWGSRPLGFFCCCNEHPAVCEDE